MEKKKCLYQESEPPLYTKVPEGYKCYYCAKCNHHLISKRLSTCHFKVLRMLMWFFALTIPLALFFLVLNIYDYYLLVQSNTKFIHAIMVFMLSYVLFYDIKRMRSFRKKYKWIKSQK